MITIVDILGSIDDKIENNENLIKKINSLLLLKFKQIYKEAEKTGVRRIKIKDYINLCTGKKDANFASRKGIYPFFTCGEKELYVDSYTFDTQAIIIAGNGNMSVKYYNGKFDAYQRTYVITVKKYFLYIYLFYKNHIKELSLSANGSVIKFLTKPMLEEIDLPILDENSMEKFEANYKLLYYIDTLIKENTKLEELKQLYLKKFFD